MPWFQKQWRMKKRVAAFCVLVLFCFFGTIFVSHPAFAQNIQAGANQIAASAPLLAKTNLITLIENIVRIALGLLGLVLVILIMYAGFMYMTARGDVEKTKKAVKIIKQAIVGVAIILSSFLIAEFVFRILLGALNPSAPEAEIVSRYSERLSGALGVAIQDHYPPRDATNIPRNTRIMVTFREPVFPESIISGYSTSTHRGSLNAGTIHITPLTKCGDATLPTLPAAALATVTAQVTADFRTYVFKPDQPLGCSAQDVNYKVTLGNGILRANTDGTSAGQSIFTGANASGYEWTFEVSTVIDLTPPKVSYVIPSANQTYDRNISAQITFDEPMDPTAATGRYHAGVPLTSFQNIEIKNRGVLENGSYDISNGYRTVSFTPEEVCGRDPCGNDIYCFSHTAAQTDPMTVLAKAASLDTAQVPQALFGANGFDGLVDAAGNSLDGNGNGTGQGPGTDDYGWGFNTNNNVNDTVPKISALAPTVLEGNVDATRDVAITFNVPMLTSTLSNRAVKLFPDPWPDTYQFWFVTASLGLNASGSEPEAGNADPANTTITATKVLIHHPAFIPSDPTTNPAGWNYYPDVTRDVKSAYQICLFPALDVGGIVTHPGTGSGLSSCTAANASAPFCCNGQPSSDACTTSTPPGVTLPDTSQP